jgi:hypothetical protein
VFALPAQSCGLRERLFHYCRGIDEYFHLLAGYRNQPSRQRLQALLDQVVIVVALRVGRDSAAVALFQNLQRIFIRAVIDAEHDDRADAGPQHARIGPAFGLGRQPIHVAMGAGFEELAKILSGRRDCRWIGYADAIESEAARFALQRSFQIRRRELGGLAQKSRST